MPTYNFTTFCFETIEIAVTVYTVKRRNREISSLHTYNFSNY